MALVAVVLRMLFSECVTIDDRSVGVDLLSGERH